MLADKVANGVSHSFPAYSLAHNKLKSPTVSRDHEYSDFVKI